MKKHALKIIGIIFLVFLSWRIIILIKSGSSTGSNQLTRPPVAVEVADIRYAPIQEIRQFTGTVYPFYQYIVAPKVSGRIIEIRKRIGEALAVREKREEVAEIKGRAAPSWTLRAFNVSSVHI